MLKCRDASNAAQFEPSGVLLKLPSIRVAYKRVSTMRSVVRHYEGDTTRKYGFRLYLNEWAHYLQLSQA